MPNISWFPVLQIEEKVNSGIREGLKRAGMSDEQTEAAMADYDN